MALSKFLLSIDWSSESETAELPTLLALWKVMIFLSIQFNPNNNNIFFNFFYTFYSSLA